VIECGPPRKGFSSMPNSFVLRPYLSRPSTGSSGVQQEEPGNASASSAAQCPLLAASPSALPFGPRFAAEGGSLPHVSASTAATPAHR
jgi:hypothetical protein